MHQSDERTFRFARIAIVFDLKIAPKEETIIQKLIPLENDRLESENGHKFHLPDNVLVRGSGPGRSEKNDSCQLNK